MLLALKLAREVSEGVVPMRRKIVHSNPLESQQEAFQSVVYHIPTHFKPCGGDQSYKHIPKMFQCVIDQISVQLPFLESSRIISAQKIVPSFLIHTLGLALRTSLTFCYSTNMYQLLTRDPTKDELLALKLFHLL